MVLTKVRVPPHRTAEIERSDLVGRLADEGDRAVTLIRAPAGYGKTTLLAQWARADRARRFGWVSLEASENDPVVLWRHVFVACRALHPGLADRAWRELQSTTPDLEAALTGLLNGLLDVAEPIVIVLDDYHVIDNDRCHATLQFFIDHLPRTIQVAISTRLRPPLSLSRLVAHGRVGEIEQVDLQFTLEETRSAVHRLVQGASPEEAALVHERSEGWPTGVYLAARQWNRAREPLAVAFDDASLRRYVQDEMLAELSAENRAFLARTSILNRLTGPLCDRITGGSRSRHRLAELASANLLFVPLDASGEWYRYHQLFQDALQEDLRREEPAEIVKLHRRAGEWWLEHGDVSAAIRHLIEAGGLAAAADLVCGHWLDTLLTGRRETVDRWLDWFPPEYPNEYPPLAVAGAWVAGFRGDVTTTRRLARVASTADFAGTSPDGAASFESSVALMRAGLGLDGMKDAARHAELAYQLEPPDSPWWPLASALAGLDRGVLGDAAGAREALTAAADGAILGVGAYALGQLSLLAIIEDLWDEAEGYAQRGIELVDELGIRDLLSSGAVYVAAAATAAHFGNAGKAAQHLRSVAAVQPWLTDAIPFDAFQINLFAAETYLVLGDTASAAVHARIADARLAAFGDAGILEERLQALFARLPADADAHGQSWPADGDALTAREQQILALLASDMSLRDVGHHLFVSRNTMKTHVSNIYHKLGVSSRTAAVARARELDLIDS